MEEEKKKFQLRWKDKLFLGVLALFLLWIGYNEIIQRNKKPEVIPQETKLFVGANSLTAEIAATPEKMSLGLGKREKLEADRGMIFLHQNPGKYAYSMRDMQFGLDFIFISKGKVVGIKSDVPADFEGEIVGEYEYDSVLEVPAGWTREHPLSLDDVVFAVRED